MIETPTITVKVSVPVPVKLVADAMCSAIEAGSYGSAYWLPRIDPPKGFRLRAAEKRDHFNWYTTPRTWTPGHGHIVTFHELSDESSGKITRIAFKVDDLGEHLARIALAAPNVFARFLNSAEEPLDGPGADEFVQWLVLGEARYG